MLYNISLQSVQLGLKQTDIQMFGLNKSPLVFYCPARNIVDHVCCFSQLRDAAKNNPVVFIPSHRSYMDFLLVSFICFATDIPLPFIAAAADFMNMRVVRTLFRNSGAFYMRRSFMSDPLYWVVFTEYLQNQLQYGDQPLEFFLEGTRSRTGKFLEPKLGRCSLSLQQTFFKLDVSWL